MAAQSALWVQGDGNEWVLTIESGAVLVWSDELQEMITDWASHFAQKYRFDMEFREDFIQECLLDAFKKVKAHKITYRSVLFTMCQRKGLDIIRRKARRVQEVPVLEAELLVGAEDELCEELWSVAAIAPLYLAITQLLIEDFWTLRQIAKVLGGTQKSLGAWMDSEREKVTLALGV